jgi:N-acetylmuramoyl-L-alanine amidase
MSTGIKNGKVNTFNIYSIIILILLSFPSHILASRPGPKTAGKWVIVIDPGHGGRDPGAIGAFSKEKDINLAVSLKTAKYIRENIKDVQVVLTRDDDSTVDLLERPKIANRNHADLFISIHTNAMPPGSKHIMGAETWIMGLASNEENLAVAMKENEVIYLEDDYTTKYQGFDPKSPESYIIFTLTQNLYQKQSLDLAWKIQTQFRDRANRRDRGVKQAGFWVLFNTTMPSVLVETGFITNAAEEKYLNSSQGQDYLASAIYRACRDFLAEIEMKSGIKVEQPSPSESAVTRSAEGSPAAAKLSAPADRIIFTVQVAASSAQTSVIPENFNGLTDIMEANTEGRYRYVTGMFRNYDEAVSHRKKIESVYPDAFVVAIKDNKVLPLPRAIEESRKQ